jgi:hypothetical protein
MTIEDRYLGDGVYASFDGYHVILRKALTGIALEPVVLAALDEFRRDVARATLRELEDAP